MLSGCVSCGTALILVRASVYVRVHRIDILYREFFGRALSACYGLCLALGLFFAATSYVVAIAQLVGSASRIAVLRGIAPAFVRTIAVTPIESLCTYGAVVFLPLMFVRRMNTYAWTSSVAIACCLAVAGMCMWRVAFPWSPDQEYLPPSLNMNAHSVTSGLHADDAFMLHQADPVRKRLLSSVVEPINTTAALTHADAQHTALQMHILATHARNTDSNSYLAGGFAAAVRGDLSADADWYAGGANALRDDGAARGADAGTRARAASMAAQSDDQADDAEYDSDQGFISRLIFGRDTPRRRTRVSRSDLTPMQAVFLVTVPLQAFLFAYHLVISDVLAELPVTGRPRRRGAASEELSLASWRGHRTHSAPRRVVREVPVHSGVISSHSPTGGISSHSPTGGSPMRPSAPNHSINSSSFGQLHVRPAHSGRQSDSPSDAVTGRSSERVILEKRRDPTYRESQPWLPMFATRAPWVTYRSMPPILATLSLVSLYLIIALSVVLMVMRNGEVGPCYWSTEPVRSGGTQFVALARAHLPHKVVTRPTSTVSPPVIPRLAPARHGVAHLLGRIAAASFPSDDAPYGAVPTYPNSAEAEYDYARGYRRSAVAAEATETYVVAGQMPLRSREADAQSTLVFAHSSHDSHIDEAPAVPHRVRPPRMAPSVAPPAPAPQRRKEVMYCDLPDSFPDVFAPDDPLRLLVSSLLACVFGLALPLLILPMRDRCLAFLRVVSAALYETIMAWGLNVFKQQQARRPASPGGLASMATGPETADLVENESPESTPLLTRGRAGRYGTSRWLIDGDASSGLQTLDSNVDRLPTAWWVYVLIVMVIQSWVFGVAGGIAHHIDAANAIAGGTIALVMFLWPGLVLLRQSLKDDVMDLLLLEDSASTALWFVVAATSVSTALVAFGIGTSVVGVHGPPSNTSHPW